MVSGNRITDLLELYALMKTHQTKFMTADACTFTRELKVIAAATNHKRCVASRLGVLGVLGG
jgi:hypothetical protein